MKILNIKNGHIDAIVFNSELDEQIDSDLRVTARMDVCDILDNELDSDLGNILSEFIEYEAN